MARASEISSSCFIVTPIGDADSVIRRHMEKVRRVLIDPALESLHPPVVPRSILDCSVTGDINQAIIEELRNSTLVIADLAYLNPNVMYELGVRCAWNLPLVTIAPHDAKLPFDRVTNKTILYDLARDVQDVQPIVKDIARLAKAAMESTPKDRSLFFAEALRTLCGGCALDAVFMAKKETLITLREALRAAKREMNKDFESKEKAVGHIIELIRPAFGALRDKASGLESVVDSCYASHAPTSHAETICKQMNDLQAFGKDLDAYICGPEQHESRFAGAKKRIDKIIGVIKKMIRTLDHSPSHMQ